MVPPFIEAERSQSQLATMELDVDALQITSADRTKADAGERQDGQLRTTRRSQDGRTLHRRHPRVIAMNKQLTKTRIPEELQIKKRFFKKESIPHAKGWVLRTMRSEQNGNTTGHIDGNDDMSKCEPMYDWQLSSFPNCNNVHELDVMHMRMINSG